MTKRSSRRRRHLDVPCWIQVESVPGSPSSPRKIATASSIEDHTSCTTETTFINSSRGGADEEAPTISETDVHKLSLMNFPLKEESNESELLDNIITREETRMSFDEVLPAPPPAPLEFREYRRRHPKTYGEEDWERLEDDEESSEPVEKSRMEEELAVFLRRDRKGKQDFSSALLDGGERFMGQMGYAPNSEDCCSDAPITPDDDLLLEEEGSSARSASSFLLDELLSDEYVEHEDEHDRCSEKKRNKLEDQIVMKDKELDLVRSQLKEMTHRLAFEQQLRTSYIAEANREIEKQRLEFRQKLERVEESQNSEVASRAEKSTRKLMQTIASLAEKVQVNEQEYHKNLDILKQELVEVKTKNNGLERQVRELTNQKDYLVQYLLRSQARESELKQELEQMKTANQRKSLRWIKSRSSLEHPREKGAERKSCKKMAAERAASLMSIGERLEL